MLPNLKIHRGSQERVPGGGNTEHLAGEVAAPGSVPPFLHPSVFPAPLSSFPFSPVSVLLCASFTLFLSVLP